MKIDVIKAFKFPIAEPDGIKNIIIGGLITLLVQIISQTSSHFFKIKSPSFEELSAGLLFFLISIPITFILCGYQAKTVNNYLNSNQPILPSWSNFFDYLKIGALAVIINLLYNFPAVIFAFAGGFLSAFIAAMKTEAVTIIPVMVAIIFILAVLMFICLCTAFVAWLFYSERLIFTDAFNGNRLLSTLKNNFADIIILGLYSLGLSILIGLATFVSCMTCIGIILIPFIYFWGSLAIINVFA